jgi:Trk-type K+ transport system membrane component
MLIIWRGLGFLVPMIAIAGLWLTESMVGSAYYQAHGWPKFAACAVAGLLVLLIGSSVNKNRPSRNNHTFFFIPFEIWGVILFVGGIVSSLSK